MMWVVLWMFATVLHSIKRGDVEKVGEKGEGYVEKVGGKGKGKGKGGIPKIFPAIPPSKGELCKKSKITGDQNSILGTTLKSKPLFLLARTPKPTRIAQN